MSVKSVSASAYDALVQRGVPLNVLLWLGALRLHGMAGKPLKKASRTVMASVCAMTEAGASLVAGWPIAFIERLDGLRVDGRQAGTAVRLNEAFPGLVHRIRMLSDGRWRRSLSEALQTYVKATWRTNAPIVGRNVSSTEQASLSGLARQLGTRYERLAAVIDALPSGVASYMTAGGRRRRFVSPPVVTQTTQHLADEVGRKQAARLLSMSIARIDQLLLDGTLLRAGQGFSLRAVEELRRRLLSASSTSASLADRICWARAMRYLVPVRDTGKIVAAVLTGALPIYRPVRAPKLDSLFMDKRALLSQTATFKRHGSQYLTLPECAQELGIKQQVAYHLARVGLLSTRRATVGQRSVAVVEHSSLARFRENFETLVSAAKAAGIDRRQALPWAIENGLQMVTGPAIDGGRQYFVEIPRPQPSKRGEAAFKPSRRERPWSSICPAPS